jgi:antitoxin VapB
MKKMGLTEAVHEALGHELEREQSKPALVETGGDFCETCAQRPGLSLASRPTRLFVTALYEMKDVHKRLGPHGTSD